MRKIKEFEQSCIAKHAVLKGRLDNPDTEFHDKARGHVKAALGDASWLPEERTALAKAVDEWLPKIVRVDMKDERKKLSLAQLRGNA